MQIRILAFLILNLVFQSVHAQSFEVIPGDTLLLEPDANAILHAYAQIRNRSISNLQLVVSREEISMAPVHTNWLCLAKECDETESSSIQDTVFLPSFSSGFNFSGHLDPHGANGTSVIRYKFRNAADRSEKASFEVRYQVGLAAIGKPVDPGRAVNVPATYDPYTQTIKVSVNGGKIEVWNMLGQKVDLNFRYDGTGMVADASSLKTGYYFLFGTNEKGPWSARVIVTKGN
jgi:hypothetical protein